MKKIITSITLVLFCLTSAKITSAQKAKRLSADLSLGIPVTMFSINSEPVGIYQGGLRYSFSPSISVSGRLSYNSFYAKPNNPPATGALSEFGAKDIVSYKNEFVGISGYLQYNLTKILRLDKKPENRLMPYLSLGAGLLFNKLSQVNTDGNRYKMSEYGNKPFRNYQLGLGARYFITSSIDAFASSEFNYIETFWMDGAHADKKNDNYINTSFGISYKIGASNYNNLLDWSHKNEPKQDEATPKDYIKWSADAHLGLPFLFTPIGYSPTMMGGLGIRYSLSRMLSFQLAYNYGKFNGSQDVSSALVSNSKPESIKEFSNSLNQISLRMLVNLKRINSEPHELNKWNYYAIIGIGTLLYNNDVTMADKIKSNIDYYKGTQNVVLGLQARKYINKNFDFLTGIDFNYNGSKWLDGAGDKASLNHHIYASAGISYKIANKNKRELIDWSNGKYNRIQGEKEMEVEKIPLIENKPKETPKVEEIKPIEKPKVEEPKIVEPKVEQPKVDEPKVVIPETKIEEPKVQVKEEPKMMKETPNDAKPLIAEKSEEIAPPPYKYNVVVACYGLSHANSAFKFRDKMRLRGFEANVYKDAGNSRILKVATISTNDKATATQILRKAKKDIDPLSWIHLYNKQ
jgi:hypothetical protein